MNENKKITCIIMFDKDSFKKIKMHVSNCVWKNKSSVEVKNLIKSLKFFEFKMRIIGTKIKESTQGSYNLYFELKKSEKLNEIQKFIYQKVTDYSNLSSLYFSLYRKTPGSRVVGLFSKL